MAAVNLSREFNSGFLFDDRQLDAACIGGRGDAVRKGFRA
jgi:hypothetical protein